MLQALDECDAPASPDSSTSTSTASCPERSQAPGFLAGAGRPVLGVLVAHVFLGVELSADTRRDVKALAVLNLQLLFALEGALERIDLTLCV